MTTKHEVTAAAAQILYRAADHAHCYNDRAILFRAIAHLTGKAVASVQHLWERTR